MGMAVTTFELKDELFIAFSNYRDSSSIYQTKLPIYVLQNRYNFILNQTIDSFRVRDVEYSKIHGDHFIVVANADDAFRVTQDYSVVYRWEAGKFIKFQRIPTNGVRDTQYFTIDTRKFISFTNRMYGSNEVSIYEWKK